MSIFQADCPYCGTKSVAFTILNEKTWEQEEPPFWWDTFAICGYCDRGIVATFETFASFPPTKYLDEFGIEDLRLMKTAPALPDTGAPRHTPKNVARFFEQAMANLPNNWDAAGAMFRKVLDTGLKHKFPEIKGKLSVRISKAAEKHHLINIHDEGKLAGEEPGPSSDSRKPSGPPTAVARGARGPQAPTLASAVAAGQWPSHIARRAGGPAGRPSPSHPGGADPV